jgi:MGT family glycosyltransferase
VQLSGASIPVNERGDESEPLDLDSDRPIVFMSLGSQIFHQPRMFEVVLEASRGQPWQLVLAMGALASETPVPSDVRALALAYAPQLAILEKARVMITHGGANSVMEALANGVPLLVAPICNDQPHNARFVSRAGAGRTCDLATASPEDVRAALAALRADGPERRTAARIAESYRAAGGRSAVADSVLRLCR